MYGFLVFLVITMFATSTYALVDYSEPVNSSVKFRSSAPKRSNPVPSSKPSPSRSVSRVSSNSSGQSYSPSGLFQLNTSHSSLTLEKEGTESKVKFIDMSAHLYTGYNLFMDMSYWAAASSDDSFTETSSYQNGNPKFSIGFNWLSLGTKEDGANFDIYAGALIKNSKQSDFATSRNHKFFGVETTKRFFNFVVGLGYEFQITDTPEDINELDIGNIQKFTAAIGWKISPDIAIEAIASQVSIGEGDLNSGRPSVRKKVSYGHIEPRLKLTLAPLVNLNLSGVFRTKRLRDPQAMIDAKLWNNRALYGNSISVGLDINI